MKNELKIMFALALGALAAILMTAAPALAWTGNGGITIVGGTGNGGVAPVSAGAVTWAQFTAAVAAAGLPIPNAANILDPGSPVTRGTAATVIGAALADKSPFVGTPLSCAFPDVSGRNGYFADGPQINYSANYGVFIGYLDGLFHPFDPLTAAQLQTVSTRLSVVVNPPQPGAPGYRTYFKMLGQYTTGNPPAPPAACQIVGG